MKTPEQMELSRLRTENGVLKKHTRIGGQRKFAPPKRRHSMLDYKSPMQFLDD